MKLKTFAKRAAAAGAVLAALVLAALPVWLHRCRWITPTLWLTTRKFFPPNGKLHQ